MLTINIESITDAISKIPEADAETLAKCTASALQMLHSVFENSDVAKTDSCCRKKHPKLFEVWQKCDQIDPNQIDDTYLNNLLKEAGGKPNDNENTLLLEDLNGDHGDVFLAKLAVICQTYQDKKNNLSLSDGLHEKPDYITRNPLYEDGERFTPNNTPEGKKKKNGRDFDDTQSFASHLSFSNVAECEAVYNALLEIIQRIVEYRSDKMFNKTVLKNDNTKKKSSKSISILNISARQDDFSEISLAASKIHSKLKRRIIYKVLYLFLLCSTNKIKMSNEFIDGKLTENIKKIVQHEEFQLTQTAQEVIIKYIGLILKNVPAENREITLDEMKLLKDEFSSAYVQQACEQLLKDIAKSEEQHENKAEEENRFINKK